MPECLEEFLSKKIPFVPQIIGRGVLPIKSLAVVAGAPKDNKSFILLNIMLDLARGRNLFGAEFHGGGHIPVLPVTKPYRVLYIENEIGDEGLRERILGMTHGEIPIGLDLYIKSRDMQMRLDTDEGKLAIGLEIDKCRPDVVILDPLAEFQLIDENSAQEMGATIRVLKRWIEKFNCAIILVHHTAKPSQDHPRSGGNALRGSSALFGAVDTMIEVVRRSEASNPTPIIELNFELRRGKPITSIQVRREESGLCEYLGEKFSGSSSEHEMASRKLPRDKKETKSRYEDL